MERFTSTFNWCYHQHALHHAFRLISWRQLSPVPVCSTFVSSHKGSGWTNDVQRIWTLGSAWNIPNTFQLQSFQVIAIKMCYTTTILPLIPSYRYRPGVWNRCFKFKSVSSQQRGCTDLTTGVAGFEPTRKGVKVPCLTTWLYPNDKQAWDTLLAISEVASLYTMWG